MKPLILALESSCDETSCAVIEGGNTILANIVSSQIPLHAPFGGVVPEIASRAHIEQISRIIDEALRKSGKAMEQMDAIAVTRGPGLIGSLHIGVMAAKTLAWAYQKPLYGIHHCIGHIYASAFICELRFPLLALLVSGGHTELVYMADEWSFTVLGMTQDDAVGEAYDKIARVIGLPYPGGPEIDRLAKQGKVHYSLPTCHTERPLDFSFSGLKSAVLQLISRLHQQGAALDKADLAYAFQETAVHDLLNKTLLALRQYPVRQILLAGGVAANSRLRQGFQEAMRQYPEIDLVLPPLWCCTDNAAMIGAAAAVAMRHQQPDDWNMNPLPGWQIEEKQ